MTQCHEDRRWPTVGLQRTRRATLGAVAALAFAASCGRSLADAPESTASPRRGGTLRMGAVEDMDHLYPASGGGFQHPRRLFARQLVQFPAAPTFAEQLRVAADLARDVPTRENGGVSADGRRYVFHLRRGVRWNSAPAREVTAGDVVRGIAMVCNPASPSPHRGYFESTIAGLAEYCSAFIAVPPAALHRNAEARQALGEMEAVSRQRYVAPEYMARSYYALGDVDRAIDWLTEGFRRIPGLR